MREFKNTGRLVRSLKDLCKLAKNGKAVVVEIKHEYWYRMPAAFVQNWNGHWLNILMEKRSIKLYKKIGGTK